MGATAGLMIVEVEKLGPQWAAMQFDCLLEDPELAETLRLSGPVSVSTEARRKDGRIQIRGELTAAGSTECSRCLEPVPLTIAAPFDVFYESQASAEDLHDLEVTDENLSVAELAGDAIDLSELVREQVLLNVPARILCSEECRGLCESCGANKNLSPCGCETETIDPRWQALKGLVEPEK
jgi:uncharacterized protein